MKNWMKKLAVGLLSAAACMSLVLPVSAAEDGWKKDGAGWWYQQPDGSYLKDCWKRVGEDWYHFAENGYMETGWQKIKDAWYYFEENGAMATGWKLLDGLWYYLDDSGAMAEGLKKIGEDTYFFDENGRMKTGPALVDGVERYFDELGRLVEQGQLDYDCPEGWISTDMGNILFFMPEESGQQTGANVIAYIIPMEGFGEYADLKEVENALKEQLPAMIPNLLMLDPERESSGPKLTSRRLVGAKTKDALEVTLTYSVLGLPMKSTVFILFFEDMCVEVCYTALTEDFSGQYQDAKALAKSISPAQ